MRFHWQNLSDAPGRERRGFWHGRAWLHFGRRSVAKIEWTHGKLGLALTLDFDRSEREAHIHVAAPGFSYYVGAEGLPARLFNALPFKYRRTEYNYMGDHRSIGVRFFDGKLWWSLWEDRHEWRHSDPKWMSGSFDFVKALLGDTDYSRRVIEERDVMIPMPEKSYPAKAKLEVATWIRSRWPWGPFSKRGTYVQIDIPGGIGIPGKGENSWDCGDDALFGLSTKARTIEDGIGHVVASALSTRRKYGWSDDRGQS